MTGVASGRVAAEVSLFQLMDEVVLHLVTEDGGFLIAREPQRGLIVMCKLEGSAQRVARPARGERITLSLCDAPTNEPVIAAGTEVLVKSPSFAPKTLRVVGVHMFSDPELWAEMMQS